MLHHGRRAALANSAAPPDAQFNYVTMLLHGDGTNGAQNNTFLDSSTNNFTITRNGNTTQGSFSPYGSNWSNYFDGSGDYLLFADNAGLEIGTNSFTFEAWIYLTAYSSAYGGSQYVSTVGAKEGTNGSVSYRLVIVGTASSYTALHWQTYSNDSTSVTTSASYAFALNTWYHVAAVRNGTTVTLYVNGTSIGSNTDATNSQNTSAPFRVGSIGYTNYEYYFPGYISNLRLVNGTAVYTSNFTPPTAPLTAITNTGILTCQSNRFVDNSTNNAAVTVYGNSSVQRFNPFGASTAYSTSGVGGSGYFDGASDYLKTSGTVGIANSAFTICCWFYPLNSSVIGLFDSGPNVGGVFRNYPANTIEDQAGGSSVSIAGDYQVNAWNWMCITKSGTSFTVYINGANAGAGTCATTMVENQFTVGTINNGGDGSYLGYISDFQVLNTSTVVSVPTAPITNASGKTYLLNFQNGAIYDNAMMNDLETVGNAQISTSVVKYGTGSIYFDGTGDYLIPPSGQNVTFGTGNFTIEGWFYWSSLASESAIMWGNGVGWTFYIYPANKLQWGTTTPQASANLLTGSTTLATGQWYHIAVTRSSNTLTLWVNGVSDGTVTDSNNYSASGRLALGISHSNAYFNGYMDDVRITKGVARYTTTFTPPTAAFPNTGPV